MRDIERRIKNLEVAMFGKSGNQWHSRGQLSDGTPIGTIGAMTHIVDNLGYPISKGYHSIVVKPFSYIGKLGATETEFRVRN